MNKKNLLVVVLVLILSSISFAQPKKVMVVKSSPTFTLQVDIHYNQAYLEFNGTYNNDFHSVDYINGTALGSDKGIGGGITSKISLTERGRLRLNFSLSYNNFKTYLFGSKHDLADVGSSNFNVLSFGAGLEHNFTPNYKYKIYLGAEGTFNMIGGKSTIWVENRYNPPPVTYDVTVNNSFRIGAAIYGGSEYMINDRTGLNLGFKYHITNLLLKDAGNSTDPNVRSFSLRDKYDATIPYSGNKTLAYITIMFGVNFYWGVQSSRYTLK